MSVVLAFLAAGTLAPESAELIARLGPDSDVHSVEAIARSGCSAVPALVSQLEIARTTQVMHFAGQAPVREFRTLWSLATLRYITGRDFYAIQARPLDGESVRQQMLTIGAPSHHSKLYGIWMSRGAVYFARPEEQASIIKQWQRFSASGRCREGQVDQDVMFWLYGDRNSDPRKR